MFLNIFKRATLSFFNYFFLKKLNCFKTMSFIILRPIVKVRQHALIYPKKNNNLRMQ
jgi:hypothetical protein